MNNERPDWEKVKHNYIGYYVSYKIVTTENENEIVGCYPKQEVIVTPCYIIDGPFPQTEDFYLQTCYYYKVEFEDEFVENGTVSMKHMNIMDRHIFDYPITENEYLNKRSFFTY